MHEQPAKCLAHPESPVGVDDTRKGAEIMLSLWLKGGGRLCLRAPNESHANHCVSLQQNNEQSQMLTVRMSS